MTPNPPMTEGEALAVEAAQHEKAWPIIGKLYLVKIGGVLQQEVYMFDQGDCEPGGSAPPFWSRDGLDDCPEFDPRKDQWIALDAIDAALSAHTAASAGEVVAEVTSDPFYGAGFIQWIRAKGMLPIGTKLYTRPPATVPADALRELVKKWRSDRSDYGHYYTKAALAMCASELAALIPKGADHGQR